MMQTLERTVQPAQAVNPPRWKMALLTFPAAYLLSSLSVLLLTPLLPGWPFLVLNFLVNIVLVSLLTYVALPLLTRLCRDWLFPSK